MGCTDCAAKNKVLTAALKLAVADVVDLRTALGVDAEPQPLAGVEADLMKRAEVALAGEEDTVVTSSHGLSQKTLSRAKDFAAGNPRTRVPRVQAGDAPVAVAGKHQVPGPGNEPGRVVPKRRGHHFGN